MSSLLNDLAEFVAIATGELAEDSISAPILRAGERVSAALRSPEIRAEIADSDRFELGPVICDVLVQLARLADYAERIANETQLAEMRTMLQHVCARLDLIFDLVPLCATVTAIDEASRALPPVSDGLRARIRAALADVAHDELGADIRQQLRRIAGTSATLDVLLPASTAIAAIANRVTYIRTRTRHVFAELGVPGPTGESTQLRTDIQTLEHFAHQFAHLVPADVAVRATLARLLGCKYTTPYSSIPQLRAVCGWDTTEVQGAYRERFGADLAELFAESDAPMRDRTLEEHAGWLALRRGDILCKQDDPGDRLYYLASGRLRVAARDSHGVERNVGEVVAGEYVGETSILTGEPRSASVYALRDSELLVLDKETFDQLQSRETLRRMTAQVAARLRSTLRNGGKTRQRIDTIAIVPARPDVSIGEFCRDVSAALGAHGSVAFLSHNDLESRHLELEDGTDSVAVSEWLDREETQHTFVVYAADAEITPWSKRCLRQADLVIVAAGATDEGPWTGTAQLAVAGSTETSDTRCDLVLLGEHQRPLRRRERSDPYGKRVSGRYYVDPARRADIERLARYIAGRAVGVVLGGGAARGYAHIGVVRALAEAGIPIDVVGGTSMGSLVAAAVAMGWTADEMLERLRIGPKVVLDFSLPLVSVARGIGFRKWLEVFVGDLDITDLDIPFYCASANMTRAEVKIHATGPLIKALMASNSGPVMLPPVVDNGDLLVDGGLLANVPWEAMRDYAEVGPLIAVDVVPPEDLAASDDYGLGLSGWRVAMHNLLPWRKALRLPSILELQMRAQLLASLTQSKHAIYEPGDLPIPIPLERFSLLGYGKIREIADAGYQAAMPAIEAWKNREPVA
jgi:NTE family protein